MSLEKARSLSAGMQALQIRYLEQLAVRHQQIVDMLPAIIRGDLGTGPGARLQSEAHKLAGTGSTYGFPRISETGKRLEEALLARPQLPSGKVANLVRALLDACEAALYVSPEQSAGAPETAKPAVAVAVNESALPLLLAVDDDPAILEIMQSMFTGDARVVTASTAEQAFALINQQRPDLILLDDNMPGQISGLQLLEKIRSIDELSGLPVIMITASDAPDNVMRGLVAGAVDYIAKPFQPEDVAEKVRACLGRRDKLILIADDDPAVTDLLAHKFRGAGYQVEVACDGEEAWYFMQASAVSLVLLDRMMPGLDGMKVMRMMQKQPTLKDIPVVFLTVRHYGADIIEGLKSGATDYITKPFDPDEVVSRCIRLLESAVAAGEQAKRGGVPAVSASGI